MPTRVRTILILAAVLLPLTGCLFRTHKVERRTYTGALMEASLDELVSRINQRAAQIETMNATVDIATSVGGEKKGKVTEYQEIRGYILLRKPETLRMIGLAPVVRSKIFDMVSTGPDFRLLLPTQSKFIVGQAEVKTPSKKPLENLRPQHILEALLVSRIDPQNEIAVLEATTEKALDPKADKEVEYPAYVINVIKRTDENSWALSRKIFISRLDLLPERQVIYDRDANIETVATYSNYREHAGLLFPELIEIVRPQEEYSIQIGMVKLRLNEPLRPDQFELERPPGTQLQVLGQPAPAATAKSQH